MDFDAVDAAGFALVDIESGSTVGSARLRSQVRELLNQSTEDEPDRVGNLLVIAVDDEGQDIESWLATEILASAD